MVRLENKLVHRFFIGETDFLGLLDPAFGVILALAFDLAVALGVGELTSGADLALAVDLAAALDIGV